MEPRTKIELGISDDDLASLLILDSTDKAKANHTAILVALLIGARADR